jgi:Rubrerythrin
MAELKGSRTEENLKTAFSGECQASIRYQYYASQAKKDGFEQIGAIFEDTSLNEKEHAKLWFKALNGGSVSATVDNLKDAIKGEDYEHTEMYVEFAKVAREEGFEDLATLFDGVGAIEEQHEKNYQKLVERLEGGEVFKCQDGKTAIWKCRNCGHIHIASEAPEACPVCKHPRAYFEVLAENF